MNWPQRVEQQFSLWGFYMAKYKMKLTSELLERCLTVGGIALAV